jgi:hypothetical protein
VRKLREITVQRGATQHEQATAHALAAQLTARLGLDRPVARREQVVRYGAAGVDRRSARSLRFVAFA